MWDTFPWFVRLAIEIVAGVVVLGAGILVFVLVLWALGVALTPFAAIWRKVSASEAAALRRQEKRRRELGYDETRSDG